MKRNIHKNLLGLLRSKGILAISGGLLLMSCGAQMGGYSETDGVYYDPNKDTLPEGVIINDGGNRVGEYYDYYQDSNVIQNAQINSREQQNKYNDWSGTNWNTNATDSDWGLYAGSQTNYYDNSWGWGYPWGWYGGYSPYWGWNRGWGWGLGLSWGWGGSFGWGWGGSFGWGNPYWGGYWGGYYDPYWGGYYGYPYWGGGYWGNGYRTTYRRSGASGGFVGSPGIGSAVYRTNTANTGSGFRDHSGGFRNGNSGGFRDGNSGGFRNGNSTGGFRQGNSGGFRNGNSGGFRDGNSGGFRSGNSGGFRNSVPQTRPNYNYQQPSQPRYNNGGFRDGNSGGFRSSGGFNSGGGGGFRGGSGGGGGMRSGGSGGFR